MYLNEVEIFASLLLGDSVKRDYCTMYVYQAKVNVIERANNIAVHLVMHYRPVVLQRRLDQHVGTCETSGEDKQLINRYFNRSMFGWQFQIASCCHLSQSIPLMAHIAHPRNDTSPRPRSYSTITFERVTWGCQIFRILRDIPYFRPLLPPPGRKPPGRTNLPYSVSQIVASLRRHCDT